MDFYDIIKEIHKSHCEQKILKYLVDYMELRDERTTLENCELRNNLELIRKFNEAKWNNNLIRTLTSTLD